MDALSRSPITPEQYHLRTRGLVSPSLRDAHVLQVGCGGGSEAAIRLARTGPKIITLVDFDVVEPQNLTRTAFTVNDIGQKKVDALAEHIRAANPFVEVRPVAENVLDLKGDHLAALLAGVDLLIAGTDSFAAQARINQWACQFEIPAVFIGVHERARGGLIVWTIPGESACYRCVAQARYEAAEQRAADLDLPGAAGLGLDVAFIDAIALKLVVAILERGQDSDLGSFIEAAKGRTQVVVRTHPLYRWDEVDLFDLVLSDLPVDPKDYKKELEHEGFFAMDSLWLRTERLPDCPDCGDLGRREALHA